jgi:hypothetical protein
MDHSKIQGFFGFLVDKILDSVYTKQGFGDFCTQAVYMFIKRWNPFQRRVAQGSSKDTSVASAQERLFLSVSISCYIHHKCVSFGK